MTPRRWAPRDTDMHANCLMRARSSQQLQTPRVYHPLLWLGMQALHALHTLGLDEREVEEVDEGELLEMAVHLGCEVDTIDQLPTSVRWIVEKALEAPLPDNWSEATDDKGGVCVRRPHPERRRERERERERGALPRSGARQRSSEDPVARGSTPTDPSSVASSGEACCPAGGTWVWAWAAPPPAYTTVRRASVLSELLKRHTRRATAQVLLQSADAQDQLGPSHGRLLPHHGSESAGASTQPNPAHRRSSLDPWRQAPDDASSKSAQRDRRLSRSPRIPLGKATAAALGGRTTKLLLLLLTMDVRMGLAIRARRR